LDFIAWANRFFGGYGPVLAHLALWAEGWPKGAAATVLDVGTGGADLPIALARWSRASGLKLRVTAIDSVPVIAAIARANAAAYPEIEVLETDLMSLAATGRRFDYVIGSLLLHHIPGPSRVDALKAADGMASRGVIFVDLLRSRTAYWGVRVLTGLFGNRITRHDGPLSVRKGFQARELDGLALKAGLTYLRASEQPFFRLCLAGEKEPARV
jgi:2-polyprenyl-3-methyl-5-hydroxy-6-metoxy-1,4-benzoquinol methylase